MTVISAFSTDRLRRSPRDPRVQYRRSKGEALVHQESSSAAQDQTSAGGQPP